MSKSNSARVILATTLAVGLAATAAAGAQSTPPGAARSTPTAAPAGEAGGDAVAIASRFLDRFDAGDFEGARADFAPEMAAALDAAKLATVSGQLAQTGAPTARSTPRVLQRDGFDVVVITVDRASARVDATISIDGEGRIAGLYFLPAQPAGD